MVGPDRDPRPRLAAELDRSVADRAETAHADLRQGQPGVEPAVRLDPGVDDARAVCEGSRAHTYGARMLLQAVRDLRGGGVQIRWRQSRVHARISPAPSSAKSPL